MHNDSVDKLAAASTQPPIAILRDEYSRARDHDATLQRLAANDQVRYCRWHGQADDGKKHAQQLGKEPWPFEGASDVRYRLADRTVNEITALLVTAWQRSVIRVGGTEVKDMRAAAVGSSLMRWVTNNKLKNDLEREAELAAQYALHHGWMAFHITWEQTLGKRLQPVTIDELIAVSQQDPASIVAELPQLIADPATADQAAAILTASVDGLTLAKARTMVAELRDTGATKIEQDYILRNLPCVTALRPHDEICFPPETVDLQRARVIFRRQLMTQVEVESMALTAGWDKAFVEAAVATMGKTSGLVDSTTAALAQLAVSQALSRTDNMIEIVYAYSRQIKDGIPAIYCTVFSPSVSEQLCAHHGLLDYAHGQYPFVEFRREAARRNIVDSRGIPEICSTDQDEIKAQHDSIRDATAFETLPPIKVAKRIGAINKVGPGVQLPVTKSDDYEFMSPPSRPPATAFNLIDTVERNHARYFGLLHEKIPPTVSQIQQQLLINKWLGVWREVYAQMYALCLQYLQSEEIERITGEALPQNLTDIAGSFDFVISFDVRELDTDYVTAKLTNIAQFLVPLDSSGEIDRAALVRLLVESIAPDAAQELVVNKVGASEKMYRQVQNDIALMMLGNEAQYVENDPAAQMKMQYLQDVMRKNPKAQQALQADQGFQMLMQNYAKNLQMSISQQQNKQIGRTGVTPVGDQLAAQQQMAPQQQPGAEQLPAEPPQAGQDQMLDPQQAALLQQEAM